MAASLSAPFASRSARFKARGSGGTSFYSPPPSSSSSSKILTDFTSAYAFRDLKAYVCTVGGPDCDTALFGDRASWFEHEIRQYRAQYRCLVCI